MPALYYRLRRRRPFDARNKTEGVAASRSCISSVYLKAPFYGGSARGGAVLRFATPDPFSGEMAV